MTDTDLADLAAILSRIAAELVAIAAALEYVAGDRE